MWGSSSDDVWAVGDRGTIIHWDGNEWKKEKIDILFNEYRFTDIWGFENNDIVVAGRIYQKEVALIRFNGLAWETVTRNSTPAAFATTWGVHSNEVYFIEYSNYLIKDDNIIRFLLLGRKSGIEKIRGSGLNNIFTVGHFGEVFHNNGLSWHKIDNLKNEFVESSALNSCYVTEKEVFAVGITPIGAIIIHGKIQ